VEFVTPVKVGKAVEEPDKEAVVIEAKDSTVGNEEVIEDVAVVSTEDDDDADADNDDGVAVAVSTNDTESIDGAVAGETDEITISVASSALDVMTSGSLSIPKVASTAYCVVDGSEVWVLVPTVAPDASIS
jgi:hypothetical protein